MGGGNPGGGCGLGLQREFQVCENFKYVIIN